MGDVIIVLSFHKAAIHTDGSVAQGRPFSLSLHNEFLAFKPRLESHFPGRPP